ncbi:NAD(P)-binding protein [Rhizophagus irregularis]|nr:NAD(P)-binding protein [Rhizophagus irregularis]
MSHSPFKTVTIAGGTKPEKENEKAKLLASKGAEIIYADYSQNDDLVKAIKGTDVSPLLAAAKDASVKRFIPSEFTGRFKSGDHFIIDDKDKFREELEKSGLEYTYIEVGIFQEFFDWLGFDIKNKKATFYVDANEKIPTTSLNDIGKYTVENLKIPEARNARINIAGSFLSLNEYLEIFEKASGSKWEVIVDKDVRHRYKNKIEPVPQFLDYYKAVLLQEGEVNLELDNDKFSFTPKPVTEFIEKLVKQAS